MKAERGSNITKPTDNNYRLVYLVKVSPWKFVCN